MTQAQQDAQKVSTCLWFDGAAEEAAALYTSLIPGSAITSTFSPDPAQPPLVVEFSLAGVPYQGLNGGPQFPQSEAVSIVVHTDDQTETDRLWEALLANGGNENRCGWLKDRFGVSWQIVPRRFIQLLSDPDPVAAGRAMAAMMQMRKLDIAALETAFNGA